MNEADRCSLPANKGPFQSGPRAWREAAARLNVLAAADSISSGSH